MARVGRSRLVSKADQTLQFRCTKAEKADIVALADAKNLTASEYLRARLLGVDKYGLPVDW